MYSVLVVTLNSQMYKKSWINFIGFGPDFSPEGIWEDLSNRTSRSSLFPPEAPHGSAHYFIFPRLFEILFT